MSLFQISAIFAAALQSLWGRAQRAASATLGEGVRALLWCLDGDEGTLRTEVAEVQAAKQAAPKSKVE